MGARSAGRVGLAAGSVRIVAYDAQWPREFRRIRSKLVRLFPRARVEHIGSTSVVGCAAKPLIDVSVGLGEGDSLHVDDARAAGLEFRLVRAGSAVFRLAGEGGLPIGFVHLRARGSEPEIRDLLFRDYLRAHPGAVAEYSRLKRRLAARISVRGAYARAKAPFIERIHRDARQWARRTSGRRRR